MTELNKGFSKGEDLELVKLRSLNKNSGDASAQEPVSIRALF